MATDFHCFWGYISHLINLLQMKVKVKCLFNLRFCLGMHLFFWRHTMFSSSISLSPDLKQRQQGRKVEEAECHSSSWLGKRSMSSSCFFSGFYEVRRNSAVWGWWFWAVPGTCGRVRFPLVLTPPCSVPFTEMSQLHSPLLLIFCGLAY